MTCSTTLESARKIAVKRSELMDQIKRALIDRLSLRLEPEEIADDSPLFGVGLALDSVDALEIALLMEVTFGVSITDDDLRSFRSVNALADLVVERSATAAGEGEAV
jgi:acyl carrier protein